MNISEILSPKFTEFDIGTPLSKVAGAFENQELDAVVVTDGDEYRGVVSRRQLASSSNQPSAKVGSRVQHVPTVNRTADVREVARLMIGSGAKRFPCWTMIASSVSSRVTASLRRFNPSSAP